MAAESGVYTANLVKGKGENPQKGGGSVWVRSLETYE